VHSAMIFSSKLPSTIITYSNKTKEESQTNCMHVTPTLTKETYF